MLLNVILSVVFALTLSGLGHVGLALANTVATTIEVGTLAWLLRSRMNGLALRSLAAVTVRCTLAAGAMAGALYGWLIVAAGLSSWLMLAGALVLGVAVYWAMIWALAVPEARQIPEVVVKRLRR